MGRRSRARTPHTVHYQAAPRPRTQGTHCTHRAPSSLDALLTRCIPCVAQEPPAEAPRRTEAELQERREARRRAHAAKGEDFSLRTLLGAAKVSDEAMGQLESNGVLHLDQLVTLVSRGDHHEELRRCGTHSPPPTLLLLQV